ncbi:venom serine protease [Drosophila albomicans]|uniref:Venom serine protease n=1 Tax=Drosophila albomicans TaxID=7291 RepID=A0A6P8YHY9_DROAB|nr:venom serine protease [Drosophila albomicans]
MFKLSVILLAVPIFFGLAKSQQCNWQYSLQPGQTINITSSNYPRPFPAGSSCRYQLHAPASHVIHLSCVFEVYPDMCQTNFLYISRDGDLQFRDGERFCRTGRVTLASHFQTMAIGYHSTNFASQQQARLSCQAIAVRVPCDCGWSLTTRITNGKEAIKHEFPSMVGLRDISSNLPIFCGGSIISDRFIVTAAHCTDRQPVASRIMAIVGVHDLSLTGESMFASQYAIQSIIRHPNYSSTRNTNDIALLQTVRRFVWSRGVAPICLPFRHIQGGEAYDVVDIAGWGTLGFGSAKSNTLQKANVMTIVNSDCSIRYNISIDANQVCTYDHTGQGQDSCQYDSGGPVILRQRNRMFLLGVISYGRSCGQRYGIGVNTRISSHLKWIGDYVGNSMCMR